MNFLVQMNLLCELKCILVIYCRGLISLGFEFLNLLLNVFIFEVLQICMYPLEILNNILNLLTCTSKLILQLLELFCIFLSRLFFSLFNHFGGCFSTNLFTLFCSFLNLIKGFSLVLLSNIIIFNFQQVLQS